MAKKSISLLEEHVEKIILGIAAVVLIWFLYSQIISPKPLRTLPEDVVAAREALEAVQERSVNKLELAKIDELVRKDNDSDNFLPLVAYNPLAPWAPPYPTMTVETAQNCVPPEVAGIRFPEATALRVTQQYASQRVGAAAAAIIKVRDLNVIDLRGVFDMKKQRELLKQAALPKKQRLPATLQFTNVMWVEIQRQRKDAKTGEWTPTDAQLNDPKAPFRLPEAFDVNLVTHHWPPKPKLPVTLSVREGATSKRVLMSEDRIRNLGLKEKLTLEERKYIDLMKEVVKQRILPLWRNQEKVRIARPGVFVAVGRGSLRPVSLIKYVPQPPAAVQPAPGLGAEAVAPAVVYNPVQSYGWPYPKEVAKQAVVAPVAPPVGELPPDGGAPPAGAANAGPRMMHQRNAVAVYFHDTKVAVGVTYRYRMRVRICNPLYGKTVLTQPAHWAKLSLAGPWSAWTAPVRLKVRSDFWLTRASTAGPGRREAGFEIFKPIGLFRRKGPATVGVGQRISVMLAELTFKNPADRPNPKDPTGPKPGQIIKIPENPLKVTDTEKKQLLFDTGCYLVDCDPDNRRLAGPPWNNRLADPSAVIMTAAGDLVERTVNKDRNDESYRKTRDLHEIGLKLPPGKAVPEKTATVQPAGESIVPGGHVPEHGKGGGPLQW